ncbi:hypothetical protein QQ008_16825 [Fulvivirgaceae bacterium BMA10]|uniref:Transposase n=1 Tax=Splendidivirga corallicola TaxID=3051826 RepID=A0ABT8KU93_9BACT|nr:hypothetical protein [Fulvivirgaceae bacterium BMA10]
MVFKEDYARSKRSAHQNRYFSESFKKQKVSEIESNLFTVSDLSRMYEVSRTSVYKWIYRYSLHRKRGIKQVIELNSDSKKIITAKT